MHKQVFDEYPQLWHYTNSVGLHGILTSQQLWATDIFYLNDSEEFTGFFDQRLLPLLHGGVEKGIAEASKTSEGLRILAANGGSEVVKRDLPKNLFSALRSITLSYQTYIASFCAPSKQDFDDGLLSQWRGYGEDGGYAIVFDTKALHELIAQEASDFYYSFVHFGDVDYHDEGVGARHEETRNWEADIHKAAASYVCSPTGNAADSFFQPILSLATRHKHRGFREESEVRISLITSKNGKPPGEAKNSGDVRSTKPVFFTPRDGILVPHIALFKRPNAELATLPIRKIIVGPHPEKLKRQKAIEKLLIQLDLVAEVVTSDIPYLGR